MGFVWEYSRFDVIAIDPTRDALIDHDTVWYREYLEFEGLARRSWLNRRASGVDWRDFLLRAFGN